VRLGLTRGWRALREASHHPEFWLFLALLCLALGGLFILGWLAARHYDTFLKLKPVFCDRDIGDRQFLTVAVLAPLGIAFALSAFGELWLIREARRAGYGNRWLYFWAFVAAAAAVGLVVFLALDC
jgi:MFS family permease